MIKTRSNGIMNIQDSFKHTKVIFHLINLETSLFKEKKDQISNKK